MRSRKSTEVRKEEIIRAALFLVEKNGLDKLNIIDIAKEVKLVPAAIYRHFKGKEDIVLALIDFVCSNLQMNLRQVSGYEGTTILKLKKLFELHVKLLKEEPAIPRILYFLLSSERNVELKFRMVSEVKNYVQQIKKILLQGQEKGEISTKVDAAAAAMLFIGMVQPLGILGQIEPQVLEEYPSYLWQCYQRSIDL